MKEPLVKARRAAAITAGFIALLIAAKGVTGVVSGSTALLADALHSTTDLLAVLTSWFGLRLASREPTRRFPYGFYRAETFAALAASGIILYLGVRLLWRGIHNLTTVPALSHPGVAIATAIASAGAALALSIWEKRVSRETGSQSLAVTADDMRMDALTSVGVFIALVAAQLKIPGAEGAATILISVMVLWVGIKNARLSVLSLMDASVDPDLERDIARLLSGIREVHHVEKVRARRSGPFYFVEGHIHVARSMDVMRSHTLTHEAQQAIREKKPEVEGVILHVEPHLEKTRRVLVPVASQDGLSASVERHFGRAAWFLIGTFDDNRLLDHRVVKNPFQERKVRAGLAVINWLVDEMRISAAILREVGEIAYHTLRDHYVEVFRASDGTVRDVLDAYAAGQLKHLPEPTHSSEIRIEDRRGADKEIEETIRQTLSKVIDPETGADVLRMGLIRHMVAENGRVRLTFRPSSPVCPQAFKLGEAIRQAVHGVPGVQQVKIKVENFNRAEELEALLQE